ncbi:unnamed protein product [Sphagnum troendelagicum]|uniref:Sorting nexin-13 n=1 Tax=Sphagnum troendelagicum TaxID=128251 RepID=A0ABP0UKM4_9BRYO
MGTLKDLVEEAKRRTILWAILVFCLAYFMSLTSSSIWINIPVAILLLAVVRRLSLEVEIRRKPPDGPPPPRHQLRRQLNPNDPLLSAPSNFARSRWRHNIDSPSVEVAVDELTKCLIDEWVTNLWYSSLTPDQEFPEELRLLINNVIGELARRVKRVDLMALICRDMVDIVGSHLELFRRIKTKVGVDVMASLSVEERDEKLKEAMLVSRELHPALISHESEYKVLKQLVGGVVALVLRREDLRCRLLRTIARELLTCAVLQPVLNFASPGFINELIESFTLTSKEKSGQANQAQSTSGDSNVKGVRSRLPERILQRKPSLSGLEMIAISNLEANISEHPGSECHGELGSVPRSDWAQVLDAVTQRRTQALTPEHLDNLWAKGRNYKKREIAKTTSLGTTVSQAADYPGKSINLVLSESRVIAKSMARTEGTSMTTNLAQLPVSLDRLHKNAASVDFLDIKQGYKSTERYKGLLFDNSEDRGQQFPGIGFSLHDTDEEHQRPLSFSEVLQNATMSILDLNLQVMGAHFEKAGSKTFAVYTIRVGDSDNRTWQVQRRFRNFEQLHRRLKDMPNYTLSLPRKRFFTSSLDNDFVLERCVLLDKYLRDLLAIPSIAELHEVWDFLSINSQHYAFGVAPSMMKTLAVNVDDAMDDMFRQIRGVSDDIQGVLKTATSGIRYRFPLGSGDISQTGMTSAFLQSAMSTTPRSSSNPKLSGPTQVLPLSDSVYGEKIFASSISEDEDHVAQEYSGVQGFGSADWQSDSDLQTETHEASTHQFGSTGLDDRGNLYFGRRPERALSEGHSPADSFMSELVEDELVIPQEWSPPKVSVPLLNLVDVIFQLQGRGWIRRQVLWMAKQILQVGLGDAIDDWLLEKIQWLRSDDIMAAGIQWVRGILWPDGIFVTKHPSRSGLSSTNSGASKGLGIEGAIKGGQTVQQQAPVNSFEYRLEALRRAMVVREILLDRAPAALVNLIGKKQYTRCATDIYNFSQSTVCVKQLAYSLLEMLLLSTFPELHDLLLDVRSGVS